MSWTNRFKKEYRIRQRRVTKYVKQTEHRSMEEITRLSTEFQADIRLLTSSANLKFVINTDQMGCEYRANVHRTLAYRGQKTVEVHIGDVNKVTHSYTAQYSITASGRLLPKVFLCLQEVTGKFGPRIQNVVDELANLYKNLVITCSKSGKLSTNLYIHTYILLKSWNHMLVKKSLLSF